MTIYLNMRAPDGSRETVDEFTRGQDAPESPREFRRYVARMVSEYNLAGIAVYQSTRPCRGWN